MTNESQKARDKFKDDVFKYGLIEGSPAYNMFKWLSWRHLSFNPYAFDVVKSNPLRKPLTKRMINRDTKNISIDELDNLSNPEESIEETYRDILDELGNEE